jgi:hypothetical protein
VYHLMAASAQEQLAWLEALRAAVGVDQNGGIDNRAALANGASRPAATPPHPPGVRTRLPATTPSPHGSPAPQARRRTHVINEPPVASPLGTRRSTSVGHDTLAALGAAVGTQSPAGASGFATPAATPPPAPPSQRKRSFLHAVADVFTGHAAAIYSPITSDSRSLASEVPVELQQVAGPRSAAAEAYCANLRPLGTGRLPPMRLLMERLGDNLPAESLMEQFERAVLYVGSHKEEFTTEKLEILQVGGREAPSYCLLGGASSSFELRNTRLGGLSDAGI